MPVPTPERGQRLATFGRGPDKEMRVCRDAYEGRPYLSLRLWEVGADQKWHPTKCGATIRMGEAAELARVLEREAEAINASSEAMKPERETPSLEGISGNPPRDALPRDRRPHRAHVDFGKLPRSKWARPRNWPGCWRGKPRRSMPQVRQ
jgi:hypothetical protein